MKTKKTLSDSTHLIYSSEFNILNDAKNSLNNTEINIEKIQADFRHFIDQYEKLLKDTIKITRISDLYEKKLIDAYEKINEQNKDLEKAMSEISTLSKLLPICSNCKKIRDDEGYWHQVEEYITQHLTDVQFTHGLCPTCCQNLYPQYYHKGSFGKGKNPESNESKEI